MPGHLAGRFLGVVEDEVHVLVNPEKAAPELPRVLQQERDPLLEDSLEEMGRSLRHHRLDRGGAFSFCLRAGQVVRCPADPIGRDGEGRGVERRERGPRSSASGLSDHRTRRVGRPERSKPSAAARAMNPAHHFSKGLDDVTVGRSQISWVGGETGELVFRGFDVRDLVPGVPYESVVHLLLYGAPPDVDPSPEVVSALRLHREVPPEIERVVDALPSGLPPLEALRTILSALGDGTYGYPPTLDEGIRLIARTPVLLARYVQRSEGRPQLAPREELSHAANYLWMLTGREPDPVRVRALEGYLDLLADHGMNASTFALRVALSTHSDLISGATAALATLKGPIHGGAPSRVSEMLDRIGSPDRAREWIRARLDRREVIFGFGHRAYKAEDPRAVILHAIARTVTSSSRLALAEAVEQVALEELRRARPGARLFANVEYYSAIVLEAVGLTPELFTPTFAVARTVGWTAHALEQAADNRLIRPEVEYVGPAKGRSWPHPLERG